MNLSGKWRIRAKFNDAIGRMSYRTVLTTKDFNGETEYYSIFLTLVGDAKLKTINDNDYITVKPENAWLSFYRKSDTETQIVAVVKDFEIEGNQNNSNDIAFNNQTSVNEFGDDLPF